MYTITDLYDLSHTLAGEYLSCFTYPWEALSGLADCIRALGASLDSDYLPFAPEVWVHKTAHIAPTASITGPCIIGPDTEVRHCAFIRGSALVGAGCVVGDSILGYKSHMGAGSITSNVKSDKTHVVVTDGAERLDTGRKKVGAMLGDFVEVGCNSVLNPGAVIGRHTRIYPLSSVRGTVPENSIYKRSGDIAAQR